MAKIISLGMLFGILAAVLISCVHARDPDGRYANSPLHQWYESQHNDRGGWCCNEADAHPYDGDYTINADGSVTIGKDIQIESWKVLKGSNPTGHAVWWYLESYNGSKATYCFMPGALT